MSFDIFSNVREFSSENRDLYDAMKLYAENVKLSMTESGALKAFSTTSKEDMEKLINKEFAIVLANQSGQALAPTADKTAIKRYATNPMVKFWANSIRDTLIDMVLPETLLTGILRYFAEFKFADYGDTIKFDIENNALFTVSRAGERKRHTDLQKLYGTTVTMHGENHQITIGTDLFSILIGQSYIAKDVMKAARSIETTMLYEAYDTFSTSMEGLTGNLNVTNYSEKSLMSLCERVGAYNQGNKAIIMGTPVALKSVLPSSTDARILLSDDYVTNGFIRNFNGFDVVPMRQVADIYNVSVPYALKLDDKKIYVISPAAQKIVKVGIFGGTITDADQAFANENKAVLTTTSKNWNTMVATNAVAGIVSNLD